jgi:hypothetical protein
MNRAHSRFHAAAPSAILLTACLVTLSAHAPVRAQSVPNADFDRGGEDPAGWKLSGGEGRWVDREMLEVTGTGEANDSNYWRCDEYPFKAGRLYHFQMRARGPIAGGCAVSGPSFANRDHHGLPKEWKWYGHVFRAPENAKGASLRLGQWQAKGTVQFDEVRVTPVLSAHRKLGDLVLGEGETIRDGCYRFLGTFGHEGSNYHRTLHRVTAGFNSDRWCFGPGSEVVYRFEFAGHKLLSGDVRFNVNYHTRGGCTAEASRDGKAWTPVATQEGLGVAEGKLPADLLPADGLFLRLRSSADSSSFQVNRIEFDAKLSGEPGDAAGETAYAAMTQGDSGLVVRGLTLASSREDGRRVIHVTVSNAGKRPASIFPVATVRQAEKSRSSGPDPFVSKLLPGQTATIALGIPPLFPGENEVEFKLAASNPAVTRPQGRLTLHLPDFYRADYGQRLRAGDADTVVWWCDATHKIARQRAAPPLVGSGRAVPLQAARNDWEAVQIVVRPNKPLEGLTAEAGRLSGPEGATIPA